MALIWSLGGCGDEACPLLPCYGKLGSWASACLFQTPSAIVEISLGCLNIVLYCYPRPGSEGLNTWSSVPSGPADGHSETSQRFDSVEFFNFFEPGIAQAHRSVSYHRLSCSATTRRRTSAPSTRRTWSRMAPRRRSLGVCSDGAWKSEVRLIDVPNFDDNTDTMLQVFNQCH